MAWNLKVECCGNCAFWPLNPYQSGEAEAYPLGTGGPHTDGSVSECRRHAPIALKHERYPSAERLFPTTRRQDFCGDFEQRG